MVRMTKSRTLAIGPDDIAFVSQLTGSLYVGGTNHFKVYSAERFSGHVIEVQGTTGRPTQVFRPTYATRPSHFAQGLSQAKVR